MAAEENRAGVSLTHQDEPVFAGAGASKRDLVDYLDTVADRILPVLAGRPLSVVRARGDQRFVQENVPRGTPSWVRTVGFWAESTQREVHYALCDDRRTLLWFANQRSVEYHVPLALAADPATPTHLVLDLDPPADDAFPAAVAAARLVRTVLADVGLAAAAKTSGAKGLHVVVPVAGRSADDVAAATRAVAARAERLDPALATTAFLRADRAGKVFLDSTRAGGATVVAAYSPRARPGLPVSFPVGWDDLDAVVPAEITVRTAPDRLGAPWTDVLGPPVELPDDLVAEGHTIPVARVAAMHEGKRRARARRESG